MKRMQMRRIEMKKIGILMLPVRKLHSIDEGSVVVDEEGGLERDAVDRPDELIPSRSQGGVARNNNMQDRVSISADRPRQIQRPRFEPGVMDLSSPAPLSAPQARLTSGGRYMILTLYRMKITTSLELIRAYLISNMNI